MPNSLISVIVPIYNVEPYLPRCIDSILSQTYQDFELILVDDGSPDGCPGICDEYAEKDSRIKVIHKENGGVSSARYAGIDESAGDYLMFVDADDYVSADYIASLAHKFSMRGDADIVIGGFTQDGGDSDRDFWVERDEEVSLEDLKKNFDFYDRRVLVSNVFSKIYKKELLGNDRFDTSLPIGEDFTFNLCYFAKCRNILFVRDANYVYNVRNTTSAMSVYNKDRFVCEERVYRAVKMFRYGEVAYADDSNDRYFCGVGTRQAFDICSQDMPWPAKKKELRAVLENDLFRMVVRGSCRNPRFNAKVWYALCKHRSYTLIRLAMFARSKIRK